MSRKYRFPTRQAAEHACEVLSQENNVSAMCLTAILNGEPSQSFRKGDYLVRVLRPMGSHGGLVVVTYRSSCCRQSDQHRTAYLEDWCREQEQDTFDNEDTRTMKHLAEQCRRYVSQCYAEDRRQSEACQELIRIGA